MFLADNMTLNVLGAREGVWFRSVTAATGDDGEYTTL